MRRSPSPWFSVTVPSSANGGVATCSLNTPLATVNVVDPSATTTTTVAGPTLPSLFVDDAIVNEPVKGVVRATFTVTVSAMSTSTRVSVQYATVDGTATSPADYRARTGRLRFSRKRLTRTITVRVMADQVSDPNETFGLVLFNPVNATLARSNATATILGG